MSESSHKKFNAELGIKTSTPEDRNGRVKMLKNYQKDTIRAEDITVKTHLHLKYLTQYEYDIIHKMHYYKAEKLSATHSLAQF